MDCRDCEYYKYCADKNGCTEYLTVLSVNSYEGTRAIEVQCALFSNAEEAEKNKDNILYCPELPAPKYVRLIEEYLLPKDYYISAPVNGCQGNYLTLHDVLFKYSSKYRKQVRKLKKKIAEAKKQKH